MLNLFFICSVALLLGCAAGPSRSATELIGKLGPYTRLTMLNGEYVGVEEYRGKTTVIVFWALWCNKSRRALAKINDFAARYKGRSDVVFIAANIDKSDKLNEVKDRIAYTHLDNFMHAYSGNEVYDEAYVAYCGNSLPHIVVLNKEGSVIAAGNDDAPVYRAFGVDPETVPDAS